MSNGLTEFLQRNKVIIHLGAHKTATTYIQSALNAQREQLRSLGVALVLPGDLRGTGVLQRTMTQNDPLASDALAGTGPDMIAFLDDLAADPATRRIVVSEEGFIGSPRNNLSRRALYPGLAGNLAHLPDALNHPNVTFLFALRDYGSFFSSSVTTTLRRGNVFELEKRRSSLLILHRSWLDVVSELRAAFPAATLKLWRYEQFQQLERQVFAEFSQGFIPTSSARVFETLSADAMQYVLDQVGPSSGRRKTRLATLEAVRKFPISDEHPAFSLWTEEEAAHLTFRYELDWREICTRYPGVSLTGE